MRKIRLISTIFLMLLTITLGTGGGVAFAESPIDVTTNVTADQVQKHNEEIAKQDTPAIDPTVVQKCDEWQKQAALEREKALTPSPQGGTRTLSDTQIPIGTNYYFTWAGEGAWWTSAWGLSSVSALANLQLRRNTVYGYAFGVGGTSAGAWNGRRFDITGTGNRLAYVNFYGTAYSQAIPSLFGSTNWKVEALVFDATTSTVIGQMTIFNASHSTSWSTYTDGGQIGHSILVSFQAGHQYVVKLQTSSGNSEYGAGNSLIDSRTGNLNTTWSYISLLWL